MDIVYNPFTVTQVREFLTAPLTNRNAVYHLKQELQTQTTAELRNRIGGILEAESKVGGGGGGEGRREKGGSWERKVEECRTMEGDVYEGVNETV